MVTWRLGVVPFDRRRGDDVGYTTKQPAVGVTERAGDFGYGSRAAGNVLVVSQKEDTLLPAFVGDVQLAAFEARPPTSHYARARFMRLTSL